MPESMLQESLPFPSPRTRGGARPGAGRPRLPGKRSPAHVKRPAHSKHHPVHVVLRTRADVPRLRTQPIFRVVRRALRELRAPMPFRVAHISIQHNHLHLLVEAKDARALSRGMQLLGAALARGINAQLGRTGHVFAFRYHATPITSPRQTRNTLAYVLNNWRRHREDERSARARAELLDPYSSGAALDAWRGRTAVARPPDYDPLPVSPPQTWLLSVGWRRHGDLDPRRVPGRLH